MYGLGGAYYRSSEYSNVQFRPKLELLISDNLSPKVVVTSPIGEDVIPSGDEANIAWNGSDDGGISAYSLYYSLDYGTSWNFVDSVDGTINNYTWKTPEVKYKSRCYFKLIIYDDKWKSSEGKTFFWIDKPTNNNEKILKNNSNVLPLKIRNLSFDINIPENNGLLNIKLKDIRGRIIKADIVNDFKNGILLDLNLSSGIYFIDIEGLPEKKSIERIILP